MNRRRIASVITLVGALWSCAPPPGPPVDVPALVVLIVVDQMRADYLQRFDAEWRGGFRRLLDGGRVYTQVELDYALTETASGHATLASGRFPRSHSVAGNKWYDRALGKIVESVEDPEWPLLGGELPGRSARHLRGTTLAGWMLERWPDARTVAISRKDRSAIWLAGGRGPHIYWFDTTLGAATSSTAFGDALPAFVEDFNREVDVRSWAGRVWESRLEPGRPYPGVREDDFEGENATRLGRTFPHRLPDDPDTAVQRAVLTPFMDEWVLELAGRAVDALELGADGTPDLLALSLGATDEIGHLFGPHSVELADQLLRLDVLLGRFLADLADRVGGERMLIVLSADHGVPPVPEESRRQGHRDARFVDMEALARGIDADLGERFGAGRYAPGVRPWRLWLDHALLAERGVDLAEARALARELALRTPGVARAFLPPELEPEPEATDDPWLKRARRSYVPDRVGDLLLVPQPYAVPYDAIDVTNHISPHPYDNRVPLIIAGARIRAGVDATPVRTVDVAPTLAGLLGLTPAEPLDGRPLPGLGARFRFRPVDRADSGPAPGGPGTSR